MVRKWIHRECERDVADLVQPTESTFGVACAVCGQLFGMVWLNEVEEPIPFTEEVAKAIEADFIHSIPKEVVFDTEAVSEPAEVILAEALEVAEEVVVEAITEPEPELEVVAVLEEVIEEIEEANEKETEIARLKAEIEELEKHA